MVGEDGKKPPQYPIESVENALRVIILLGEHGGLRLSAIRDALGVGQSTAFRLMAMLEYHGFAQRDVVTKVYRPGSTLIGLGLAALGSLDIRVVARPILEELATETGETVHLGVLDGRSVRYIDAVESSQSLRVAAALGADYPAHCTSAGKALLAAMPDEELRVLLKGRKLEARTASTVRSVKELQAQLDRARTDGYVFSSEEAEPGVAAVAVSIVSDGGEVRAAVSVAMPTLRTSPEVAARVIRQLGEARDKMLLVMGDSPTGPLIARESAF